MARRRTSMTVLSVLLATAACSEDEPPDPFAAADRPPVPSAIPAASPAPSAPERGGSTPPEVAAATTVFFTSPTGNILCSLGGPNAVCEIREHSFVPPERPADCQLDFGTMLAVGGAGPARFLCHGDTAFGSLSTVLAYGARTTNGLVTCTSRESGMACSSADGRHGFALSRTSYRLY